MNIYAIRRARLRLLIDNIAGGNISAFAGRFDYSRSRMSQYLSETYNDGRSMGERAARSLEEYAGVPSGWMDRPIEEDETAGSFRPKKLDDDYPAPLEPTSGELLPKNLIVTATLLAQEVGAVRLVDMPADTKARFLEFHSRDPQAYALLVRGNKLRPRFKSGEFLVIEPTQGYVPGDDVLVTLTNGRHLIAQLLYWFPNDDEMTFGDINESAPTTLLEVSEILKIELISSIVRTATLKEEF